MIEDAQIAVVKEPKLGTKGQLRKAKVLSVARTILLEEGVDNLILRKVATRADIKLGHLQYYFPTRDDLLEALINEAWETDEAVLVSATTPDEIKAVVHDLLVGWSGDRGKIYLVLTLRSLFDERFRLLKQNIYQNFYEDLVLFLKVVHPDRSKQDLLRKAKMITSIMDGAMLQDHKGTERVVKKQRSDFYNDLIEMVLNVVLA